MASRFSKCEYTGIELRLAKNTAGKQYSDETCSLDISLHNERCDGIPFLAILYWAARQNFNAYEIALGDTLYRHSYMAIGHPDFGKLCPDRAEAIARKEGDDWLSRNGENIRNVLGENVVVRRWDEWRQRTEFHQALQDTLDLLSHETFVKSLDQDIVQFTQRKMVSRQPSPSEFESMKRFVIEETAVYYMHSSGGPVRHVYPGKALATLRVFAQKENENKFVNSKVFNVLSGMRRSNLDVRIENGDRNLRRENKL